MKVTTTYFKIIFEKLGCINKKMCFDKAMCWVSSTFAHCPELWARHCSLCAAQTVSQLLLLKRWHNYTGSLIKLIVTVNYLKYSITIIILARYTLQHLGIYFINLGLTSIKLMTARASIARGNSGNTWCLLNKYKITL